MFFMTQLMKQITQIIEELVFMYKFVIFDSCTVKNGIFACSTELTNCHKNSRFL